MAKRNLFSNFKLVSGCMYYGKDQCSGKAKPFKLMSGKISGACEKHTGELKFCQMILTTDWMKYREAHL